MIVKLTGGIGNQLFQYAFGRSLAYKYNEPLKFEFRRATRDYALEPFHLPIELVETTNPMSYYREATNKYDPNALSPLRDYYDGYWQSEKYFNVDLIRTDFPHWVYTPGHQLFPSNYVSIHVRRGDYLNPGTREYHGVSLERYYQAAIDYMKERVVNPTFIVFTDDPDLKEFIGYPVASVGDAHVDLWTLTKFNNSILANSTFGWWAAWLGEAKNVVAPKQWFIDPKIDTSDLIPERWVRL